MTDQRPTVTPPPELVQEWLSEFYGSPTAPATSTLHVATRAAGWGCVQRGEVGEVNEAQLQQARDQELEACCEVLENDLCCFVSDDLRAARRPKPQPPSLKGQALNHFELFAATFESIGGDSDLIIRALEALPND